MKPSSRKYAEWEQSISRVKTGMTKAEVDRFLGAPSALVHSGELEIFAYHLERIGDTIYSIRTAFNNGQATQCYLGVELCDSVAPNKSSTAARYFQLFLVVIIGAVMALIYAWFAAR